MTGGESHTRVRRVVREGLGTGVERCRRASGGAVADTYLLDLAGDPERAVCKLGGASVWTAEVIEPLVARLVWAETDLPIPAVLASGAIRNTSGPDRWALYGYREGRSARTAGVAGRGWFLRAGGRLLGRLHEAFAFDRVGGLGRADGALRLRQPARRNLLASSLVPVPGPGGADGRPQPVLTHGDYQPSNLLVADGEVTAVLDWGNAHVTDAGYALARAETRFVDLPRLDDRRRAREAFRDGYASVRDGLPPGYTDRVARYRALWLAQSTLHVGAIAATPRGRRQLRRQVRNWLGRRDLPGGTVLPG